VREPLPPNDSYLRSKCHVGRGEGQRIFCSLKISVTPRLSRGARVSTCICHLSVVSSSKLGRMGLMLLSPTISVGIASVPLVAWGLLFRLKDLHDIGSCGAKYWSAHQTNIANHELPRDEDVRRRVNLPCLALSPWRVWGHRVDARGELPKLAKHDTALENFEEEKAVVVCGMSVESSSRRHPYCFDYEHGAARGSRPSCLRPPT
jgi:hypothetical protein